MDMEERGRRTERFFAEASGLLERKGRDYNPTGKAYAEEEEVSLDLGLGKRPELVLWIYMSKHIRAVRAFMAGKKLHSEGVRGRLLDLAAYCAILAAYLEGEQNDKG